MEIRGKGMHEGACNFCNRGVLVETGDFLTYPYDRIYEVVGTSVSVRFCPQCLAELVAVGRKLLADGHWRNRRG